MSMIDAVKRMGAKPSTALAFPPSAEIAARLAEAEAAIGPLEARHGELAYLAEIGEAPESDAASALAELRAARDRAASLSAALARARDVEAAKAAEARAAVHKSQINAVRQHLARRDSAVAKLSEHLAAAVDAYAAALAANDKAIAAAPAGARLPAGALCDHGSFTAAVRDELYRLSAGLMGTDRINPARLAFPGAKASDFSTSGDPSRIPPLVEQAKAASEHTLAVLMGRAPQ